MSHLVTELTAKKLLHRNVLFRDLPNSSIDKIAAVAHTRSYPKGQEIFRKGDPGDALYAIVAGQVRIHTTAPDGQERSIRVFEPGEAFGEIAAIDGGPRTASATAVAPSRLVVLDRGHLLGLLHREPKIAMHFLELLCARLRYTSELVEDSAFLDVPAHLAKRLHELANDHGTRTDHGIALDMSQLELANFLPVSRQAVNQCLQDWREEGWVDLARGRIIVRNAEALRLVGGRDAGKQDRTEQETHTR